MKQILRIIRATKSLWRYYLVIGLLTVLVAAVNLAMPFLTGQAIDEVTRGTQASIKHLIILVGLIFLSDLLYNLFSNFSGYLGDQMAAKVQRILSIDYYEHILSLPQHYFDTELTGKIINRLSRSVFQIANFMNILANNFLQFIFSTIIALIIIALYSWQVALLLLVLYPVFIILTVASSPKWRAYQHDKNEAQDIATGRFNETIGEIKAVKSFNQEGHELSFFRHNMNKLVDLTRPQSIHWHKWDTWRRLALNIIFLGVYLFIFIRAAHGGMTPGDAVALILYGMQIRIPLFTISFLVAQTQRAMADSREYFKAMDEQPQLSDKPNAKKLSVKSGRVEFRDISFSYNTSEPVLRGISFELEPGKKTALVGESGEGKTTITNLLLRLYELNNGQIVIDDQDITEVSQASLRKQISVVFQEPTLFSGTIRENINYSKPRASKSETIQAAKQANIWAFISKLKHGLDTEIGERGLKLSGGQKQRIAIARAILKDAPVLILDEATSSLDSRSEHEVQKALEKLMHGRTTLIIAHRLSTIAGVDKIITLKGGQVDEVGSPGELAKSGGIYSQLLELQANHSKENAEQLQQFDIAP